MTTHCDRFWIVSAEIPFSGIQKLSSENSVVIGNRYVKVCVLCEFHYAVKIAQVFSFSKALTRTLKIVNPLFPNLAVVGIRQGRHY
jgi:hypothetical protein